MKKINLISLIFLTAILVACGSDSKKIPFDLNVEGIESDTLNDQQKLLLNQIKKDRNFDPELLDQLLIEAHVSDYNKRKDTKLTAQELESFLISVKEKVSLKPEASASERKVAYEAVIGEPILYNRDSVSVGDLWQEKRLQCYSGSVFYHMMAQRLRGNAKDYYTKENPVFVYTPGHIEPGVIVDGVLQTIETTASGEAKVIYGKASELRGCIQVVRADYFALIEAMKADVKIPASLVREAIEKTAETYSIDLKRFQCEGSGIEDYFSQLAEDSSNLLNSSPLGLAGNREVKAGDQERVKFDLQDKSVYYTTDAEDLQPLPAWPPAEEDWEKQLLARLEEACPSLFSMVEDFYECLEYEWPSSKEVTKENFTKLLRIYIASSNQSSLPQSSLTDEAIQREWERFKRDWHPDDKV